MWNINGEDERENRDLLRDARVMLLSELGVVTTAV